MFLVFATFRSLYKGRRRDPLEHLKWEITHKEEREY